MRSVLLPVAAAAMMSATAAFADNKSDCQKGVAMIKAKLKKKHVDRRDHAAGTYVPLRSGARIPALLEDRPTIAIPQAAATS